MDLSEWILRWGFLWFRHGPGFLNVVEFWWSSWSPLTCGSGRRDEALVVHFGGACPVGGSLGVWLVRGWVQWIPGSLRHLSRAPVPLWTGFDLVVKVFAISTANWEVGVVHKNGDQVACEAILNFKFGFPTLTRVQGYIESWVAEVVVLCVLA